MSAARARLLDSAIAIGVALLALAACRGVFEFVFWQTHEWTHYATRVSEYAQVLQLEPGYVRWCPDFYGGFGSPFFNYYAPGVYAVAAVGVLFGLAATSALKLVVVAATVLGTMGTFALVRGETGRNDAAALAAVTLLYNPYRFFNIWKRGDIAEVSALGAAVFVWWALRALGRVDKARAPWVALGGAASGAAVILCHTITGQWTMGIAVLVAGATAVSCVRRGERWRLPLFAVAIVGAVGLSAIYIGPALLEREYVLIERLVEGAFTLDKNAGDLAVLVDWTRPFFIGETTLLGMMAMAIALAHPRLRARVRPIWPWWAGVIVLLLLTLEKMLWAWSLIPLGRFTQFPWRVMGPSGILAAIAVGLTWAALVPARRAALVAALAVCAAVAGFSVGARQNQVGAPMVESMFPSLGQIYEGTVVVNEYVPRTVGPFPIVPRVAVAMPATGTVRIHEAVKDGVGTSVRVDASGGEATIDVLVFYFPGWWVETLKGPAPAELQASPSGLQRVKLPKPGSYELRIRFGHTPVRKAATATSALALLLLPLLMAWLARRWAAPSAAPDGLARPSLTVASVPQTLIFLWLATLPLWLSGPIRAVTHVDLSDALWIAIALTVPLTGWLFHRARVRDRRVEGIGVLAFAVLFLASFAALYNHDFYGSPTFSGIPDAAHHVQSRMAFATRDPKVYGQFVAQFAFSTWVMRLFNLDEFFGLTVASYFALAIYLMSIAGIVAGRLAKVHARELLAGTAGALVAATAISWTVILPLFHYYQAEGFHPQLFAVVPLCAIWVADAMLARAAWLCAIGILVALYRYAYGLHLVEVLGVLAILALVEAWRAQWKWRVVFGAAALGFAAVAYRVLVLLLPVYHREGPFIPFELSRVLLGQWLLVAALGLVWLVPRFRAAAREDGFLRWLRLPFWMGLGSSLFLTLVPPPARGQDYYFFKQNFHALLLLAAAAIPLAGWAATRLPTRKSAVVLLVAVAAAAISFERGFVPWRENFHARVFRRRPYGALKPLADLDANARIERVLKSERKQFGGYLTSYYPLMLFTNSQYEFVNGGISFYWGWPPREQPGNCVFWEWCSDERNCLEGGFPQRSRIQGYMRDPARQCVGYHPHWNPSAIRELCWKCY